jgi:hypothetical protein
MPMSTEPHSRNHLEKVYSGSCLCGLVRYEFDAEPRVTVTCHCSRCRKATGSAFGTWTLVSQARFRWASGSEHLVEHRSSEHGQRFFCGRCGAILGNLTTLRPGIMHVAAGTLDEAPPLRIAFHAYVGSKAPWYQITDDIPQHAELPSHSER